MRFLGSKYANNAFAAGALPRNPLGELTALHQTLAGKGGGAPRDGPHPEGGSPGRRGEEEKGRGRGRGKLLPPDVRFYG